MFELKIINKLFKPEERNENISFQVVENIILVRESDIPSNYNMNDINNELLSCVKNLSKKHEVVKVLVDMRIFDKKGRHWWWLGKSFRSMFKFAYMVRLNNCGKLVEDKLSDLMCNGGSIFRLEPEDSVAIAEYAISNNYISHPDCSVDFETKGA